GDKFASKKHGAGAAVGYNLAVSPVAMSITLNGESRTLSSTASVRDLILELGLDEDAVAVERNRAIVRRPRWAETMLRSGDRIEVVRFVGGG
ncbi:MAG: sulfur carrier protein ThiS, partial [Bryobacterales bacterium]|nr:sulfur carrier protein ThiS [Bryobacterales bacterium]